MKLTEVLSILVPPLSGLIGALVGALVGGYIQKRTTEYEIRYARDYQRRADVIDHLYKLVIQAQKDLPRLPVRAMVKGIVKVDQPLLLNQAKNFLTSAEKMAQYYEENALWFDPKTRAAMQRFVDVSLAAVSNAINVALPDVEPWRKEIAHTNQALFYPHEDSFAALRRQIDNIPEEYDLEAHLEALLQKRKAIYESFAAVRKALECEFRRNLQGP